MGIFEGFHWYYAWCLIFAQCQPKSSYASCNYVNLLLSLIYTGLFYCMSFTKVDNAFALQLFTTITVNEPAPGLKTIFSFRVPDQRSGKVR